MLTLSGLEEYTQYIIRISASTQIGTGPVGTSFVTTAADGELWNSIIKYSRLRLIGSKYARIKVTQLSGVYCT